MEWEWILRDCFLPTLYQGVLISLPLLLPSLLLRVCVQFRGVNPFALNAAASILGLGVLWWYYEKSSVYFIVLSVVVYMMLLVLLGRGRKGTIVAVVCVAFIIICELFIASPTEWHKVRGSFLILAMKLVSLGFDIDIEKQVSKGEIRGPTIVQMPSFIAYTSYCYFPATTIFGPFLTFNQHAKFLEPTPLSLSWLWAVMRSWFSSLFCLGVSVCLMPFLFNEPHWNKWMAAYSAAASFRYSHYFVCFLSECTALAAGIGYEPLPDGTLNWSSFRIVHPLAIELPRSLGNVVNNWNLPMHLFLKKYVFKPSLSYLGKFGGVIVTYLASAILHGLNFQLAAVLLSIGVYAYIENVLRYKLSKRCNACILDKPCPEICSHQYKRRLWWVVLVNTGFTLLSMFHLAYLGLMFGSQTEEEDRLELQGYSMMHTLRKWGHLDYLSHWVALLTYVISTLL